MSHTFSLSSSRLAAAAALASLTLGLAACGDDEPKASATTPPPAASTPAAADGGNAELDKQIAADTAALKKKGFKPEGTVPASARGGILRVGHVTVFYFNDAAATDAAEKELSRTDKVAGTKSETVREGNHILVGDYAGGAEVTAELKKLKAAYKAGL